MRERLTEFSAGSFFAAPDQRTGFLLQQAHQRTRRAFNEALRALQIETRHLGVLTALAGDNALNQKQLVEQLDLDKSAVVLIVDDLERLGLARRRPAPRDRRAHSVQITERGRQRLKRAQRIAVRLGRRIFRGLNHDERRQLDRVLLQIIQNCEIRRLTGERLP